MTISIVEAIQSRLSEDVVSRVAGSTGEPPTKARAGLSAGAFAAVAGLIRRGGTQEGAAGILSNLKGSAPGIGLFGNRTDDLSDAVAQSSGVSRGSATTILATLGPIAAGVLGKAVLSRNLDASALSASLLGQKASLLADPNLPAGLTHVLSPSGGVVSKTAGAEVVTERVTERYGETHRDVAVIDSPQVRRPVVATPARPRMPWGGILTALALGALLLAGLLFFVGRKPQVSMPDLPKVETPVVRAPELQKPELQKPDLQKPEIQKPEMAKPETPEMTRPELAKPEVTGETTITSAEVGAASAAKDGITEHFTGTAALPESFVLPRANFAFASTTMIAGGEASVTRLAQLLKDHPSARIRLEGHTDPIGSQDINAPLSFNRAEAVKKKLVAEGIDADRIETIGLRDKRPVASNDSKEGRLDNRRVDVVLLSR